MDDISKRKCRFCLTTVHNNEFQLIGETMRQMFDALLIIPNWKVNNETLICNECSTKLQKAFDFKTACLNRKNIMFPSINMEDNSKEDNKKENINVGLSDVIEDQKICQFCMEMTKSGCCTYLHETKENVFIVDMIQKYIPELQLNVKEELVTCNICRESLQNLLSFIRDSLNIEDIIKKEVDTVYVEDQLKLNDICDSTLKYEINYSDVIVKIEEGCDENEGYVTVKDEIKYENILETNNPEINIINDEIEIKSEQNECESGRQERNENILNGTARRLAIENKKYVRVIKSIKNSEYYLKRRREKNAEVKRRYREKIRSDPARYEQFKEYARERYRKQKAEGKIRPTSQNNFGQLGLQRQSLRKDPTIGDTYILPDNTIVSLQIRPQLTEHDEKFSASPSTSNSTIGRT